MTQFVHCMGRNGANTNAINELSLRAVIQNPPHPPFSKGGWGGFEQEFDLGKCQICYCVRISYDFEIDPEPEHAFEIYIFTSIA
jgi:hypothetical protein